MRRLLITVFALASLLAAPLASARLLTLPDASGNVTAWSTGNKLADDRRFDSFGNAYAGTAAATHYSNVGYRGQLHDARGLIFLRNRYYGPTVGNFTQPDPIRSGFHWYAYPSDPVSNWDPEGLDDIDVATDWTVGRRRGLLENRRWPSA